MFVAKSPPSSIAPNVRAHLDREFHEIERALRDLGTDRRLGVTLWDFGAKGDGVRDDAGALQEAINASIESGGSVPAIIPYGQFLIGSRVEINGPCSLIGLGCGSVLLGPSGGTHIILLVQSDTFDAIEGIRLEHFVVDGNGGGQLDAGLVQINNARVFLANRLWVKNGTRVSGVSGVNGISCSAGAVAGYGPSGVIANSLFENTSKAPINWTTGGDGCAILSNFIRDVGGNGSCPGVQVNGGAGAKVIGNDIQNTEGPGIYVAAVGTVPPIDAEDTIIAANRVKNCGASSATNPHGIQIANATASVEGRVIVSGNVVTDIGNVIGGGNCILIQNTKNVVCANNVCRNGYYDGIRVESSDYAAVNGNRCTGNNVAALGAGGIRIKGTCSHVSVIGNNCADDNATQDYGLVLESGATLSYLTVRDNDLEGNVLGPLLAAADVSHCDIELVAELQTTDAVASAIQSFTLPDPGVYHVQAHAVGLDGANVGKFSIEGVMRRSGGGATQEGATATLGTDINPAAWGGADLATASNAFSVHVEGKAATTIDWRVRIAVLGL